VSIKDQTYTQICFPFFLLYVSRIGKCSMVHKSILVCVIVNENIKIFTIVIPLV
jgi:hypothetical protein